MGIVKEETLKAIFEAEHEICSISDLLENFSDNDNLYDKFIAVEQACYVRGYMDAMKRFLSEDK